jgi:ATP-dependent Lon protease
MKKKTVEKVNLDSKVSKDVNGDTYAKTLNISTNDIQNTLPVLPLKDIVIFPYMVYPILAGRDSSIRAINKASEDENKYIFLVTQKDGSVEETAVDNLYKTGVIAKILQVIRLPNGLMKILVDAVVAAKVLNYYKDDFLYADLDIKYEHNVPDAQLDLLAVRISKLFSDYVKLNPALTKDTFASYEVLKDYDRKLYFIASTLSVNIFDKQKLLDIEGMYEKFFDLITMLVAETQVLKIEKEIEAKVQASMQKNQRKFIVQEQIRILQDELGGSAELDPDLMKLKKAIDEADMPEAVKAKKLPRMDDFRSLEYSYRR